MPAAATPITALIYAEVPATATTAPLCKQILTWPENPGRRGKIIGGSSAEEAIRLTIQSIMADVQAAAHKAQNGTEGGLIAGKMADVSCRCVSVRRKASSA